MGLSVEQRPAMVMTSCARRSISGCPRCTDQNPEAATAHVARCESTPQPKIETVQIARRLLSNAQRFLGSINVNPLTSSAP